MSIEFLSGNHGVWLDCLDIRQGTCWGVFCGFGVCLCQRAVSWVMVDDWFLFLSLMSCVSGSRTWFFDRTPPRHVSYQCLVASTPTHSQWVPTITQNHWLCNSLRLFLKSDNAWYIHVNIDMSLRMRHRFVWTL